MYKLLDKINCPEDLKKLADDQLTDLSEEIRQAVLFRLSEHGGHYGPNLGIIEATVALHYVFNSPTDKFVFDVSHQCYAHKILTGRKEGFINKDKFKEISGFTNPDESEHDSFKIGHTSTSISLASGLVKARDLKGEKYNVVAIIGDGSLSGGEALEGLDYAYELGTNFIIVVNDNQMSISDNYGGLYQNLKELRESDGKCKNNLFKALGLDYVFVKDGNDVSQLIKAFRQVKDTDKPTVVHICTLKGKGFSFAEQDKESWHATGPADLTTGKLKFTSDGESYSSLTRDYLLDKMKKDSKVIAINASTPAIFAFDKETRKIAGKQFIDVGIAEEHAVALASGVAKGGGKPIYAVFSSFMQRTYDQLSQDVCINNNPITMLVFAGSIYGMRDVTHLGIYDIAMISNIPNMVYLAPTCVEEYFKMLDWSVEQTKYPVAIRVPGNGVNHSLRKFDDDYSVINKNEVVRKGSKVAILAVGDFFEIGEQVSSMLKEKTGQIPTLISPRYLTGLDRELLDELKNNHDIVITIEDGSLDGGYGEKVARYYSSSEVKVLCYGFKKEFLDRFNLNEVLKSNRLTPEQICEDIIKLI